MRGKKAILPAVLVLAFAAAAPAGATKNLGAPDSASCDGQTTAALAQTWKTAPDASHGFAGEARDSNLTVKELHAQVVDFCNTPAP